VMPCMMTPIRFMNFLPRRPFPESRFRQTWQFVTIWLFVVVKDAICQGVFGRKITCCGGGWNHGLVPRRKRKRRASRMRMARRRCC
ncbi:hypothetical protein, partial [Rhizobium oryzihabitans]|uniref:hypothetical protein n=1 Tax=Rhizobium oryzihabitans TaxID=2267833 RepID=UPI004036C203